MQNFTTFFKPAEPEQKPEHKPAVLDSFVESLEAYGEGKKKIESLSLIVNELSEILTDYVSKGELSSISSILVQHIDTIKEEIELITKKDLSLVNENIKKLALKSGEVTKLVNEELAGNKKLIQEQAILQDEKLTTIKDYVSSLDPKQVEDQLENISEQLNTLKESVEETTLSLKEDLEKNRKHIVESTFSSNATVEELKKQYEIAIEDLKSNQERQINQLVNVVESLGVDSLSKQVDEILKKTKTQDKKLKEITEVKADFAVLSTKVDKLKDNELVTKLESVEKEVELLDSVISKQNNKMELIESEVESVIKDLKKAFNDEKYYTINKKFEYFEDILEKFNEKTLLAEALEPPAANPDPLANQNFVTFEQLQKHYTTFINRIQQQLTSLGGGGAGWLYDLADIDYKSVANPANGAVLAYITANARWEATTTLSNVSGGGGGSGGGLQFTYANVAPTSPNAGDIWYNTDDGYRYQYINDGNSTQWVTFETGSGLQFTYGPTAPTSPITGDIWLNSSDGYRYQYIDDGNSKQWVTFETGTGMQFTYSDTAPTSPIAGDIWFNTVDGNRYQYIDDGNSFQWVTFDVGNTITAPSILNDISPQFDGSKTTFPLRVDQSTLNTIVDSKDLEVVVNGLKLAPYITEYKYPWIVTFDSFNGYRVRNFNSIGYVTIYNAPFRGDSGILTYRSMSIAKQTKRYPFSAATIAFGD